MPSKSRSSGISTPSRVASSQNTSATAASGNNSNPFSTSSATATTSNLLSRSSKPTSKPSPSSSSAASTSSPQEILAQLWNSYVDKTPQRTKLIDTFMAFLMLVGAIQFVYCVLLGNYPFNAFLSGFGMTVGQFVLTASLRIQTNPENAREFKTVSPERAFADFVLGSLVLHFFCVNFIN